MGSARTVVLILDTDEATLELYSRELGRRYQVLTCTSERAAWEIIRRRQVDVLVLEPTALNDERWGFVDRIRSMEARNTLPIIVCSTLDARRQGVEMGAAAYLIKPVSPHELVTTLAAVVREPAAKTAPQKPRPSLD